jgi:predicted enzyme related to lactoylglutathione lyase
VAYEIPHGRTLDTDFMFTKLLVDDLEQAAAFYTSVCGVVEMHKVEAEITGRKVSEIVYMPTYQGGPMFILAKFHGAPKPANDEVILGFATKDLDAFVARVEAAGGRILEKSADDHPSGFRHAFVTDIEGNNLQISQSIG